MFVPLLLFFLFCCFPPSGILFPGSPSSVPQQYLQYIQHAGCSCFWLPVSLLLRSLFLTRDVPTTPECAVCFNLLQLCVRVDLPPICAHWGGPFTRVMGTTHSGGYRSQQCAVVVFSGAVVIRLTCEIVVQQVLGNDRHCPRHNRLMDDGIHF